MYTGGQGIEWLDLLGSQEELHGGSVCELDLDRDFQEHKRSLFWEKYGV